MGLSFKVKYILKKSCVQISYPLKRKTNLNLAPARLALWDTKQVLCECLQQGHEARLATSQLEGMDFATDLGSCYYGLRAVCFELRYLGTV